MRGTLARSVLVGAVLASGGLASCGSSDEEPQTFCQADAVIGPQGQTFGRSREHGCRFVDAQGEPLTTLPDGSPLCYDDSLAAVACE